MTPAAIEVPDDGGPEPGAAVVALCELTRLLRRECPWDRAQTAATIVPHTLEEAYEVADVVQRLTTGVEGDLHVLEDELGDLLFQVLLLTLLLEEQDRSITIDSVARTSHAKLVRRHPHVFGESVKAGTADEVRSAWENVKRSQEGRGLFDGIPDAMPAVGQARKVQARAGGVGFDFADPRQAMEKLHEELGELEAEVLRSIDEGTMPHGEEAPPDSAVESEVGDLLFAAVNVARLSRVDPELALRGATARFRGRVEGAIVLAERAGEDFTALGLEAQELWYQRAKEGL